MLRTISTAAMLALMSGCFYTPAAPTVAPDFHANHPVSFVSSEGKFVADLVKVDYSVRSSAAAITSADVGSLDEVNTLPSPFGSIVFAFNQLLDGYTVETPVYKPQIVDGQPVPITIGQGDWKNKLRIVIGFTPHPSLLKYEDSTHTNPADNDTFVFGEYHPDGGWLIDPAGTILNNPPPSIVVKPNDPNGFASGETVIIHLMAHEAKGITGIEIEGATNIDGDPIMLNIGGTPTPVVATVVLVVP